MSKKQYQPLTIPRLSWNKSSYSATYAEFVAQPLEPGFGITLGNALRRVLLGGVEGSAVTSVIIAGVNNEFSPLKGVVEDTMQVVLNIKELVVSNKTGEPGMMTLKIKGEHVAKASDIVADEHLEIINKDHIIAHVAESGVLDIQFYVESGRGYRPAQWPIGQALQEDERIHLDALFSPVVKVTFDVEKTRVGKEIDYDKLTVAVTTDGSESPSDVVHYSVSVLRTQLEHFLVTAEIPFNEISPVLDDQPAEEEVSVEESTLKGVPLELLLKPIDELELSVRAHNCLISSGIKRVIDLVNLSEDEGLKIKNFGRKSLNEVKDAMKSFGLSFGMNIKESSIKKMLEGKDKEIAS
ncbi:DNA-directed RNA polymerase subunit alpha [Candidatus Dependentiae bacterium]|nr:DNA-directed RNA polymerase subunit alpha [Candidatus Dependentiae bacterium]